MRGTFESDHGQWPTRVEGLAFRPPDGGAQAVSSTERGHPLDCEFERPTWECVVPANAPLDLRLRPSGFASLFFWDVTAAEDITLEPRPLRRGASISGWVEGPNGKPIEGARISVSPSAHAPSEDARQAAQQGIARTDRRGFFQVSGLAEGEYRLISRADRFSPSRGDSLAPMKMFMVPPSPSGLYDGAAYLEPGVYAVCSERAMTSRCRSITITAGAEATLENLKSQEKTR